MPFSTYLPEHMGAMQLTPSGPFVAGSYAELILTYTAGTFGIDGTGMVKISWRTTSDMSKPQFDKPARRTSPRSRPATVPSSMSGSIGSTSAPTPTRS
jgi:hypothetical protein